MVKNAAAKSPYETEKPLNSAAPAHLSHQQSQQFLRHTADDIILSLANAYENKRARQVSEWERVQVTRWQRAV
jgi:hypothetical protein